MRLGVISFFAFVLLTFDITTRVTSQAFPKTLAVGPHVIIKGFDLTEDLDLSIILANAGQTDLPKGSALGVQIFVNHRKISQFDHYVLGSLKANFGNRCVVDPPSRVGISGISRVKVSISSKRVSDSVQSGDHSMERTFVVFPLKMGPREKQSYSVSLIPPSLKDVKDGVQVGKMKLETRLDGEGKVGLSVRRQDGLMSRSNFSGKTPLKAEVPLYFETGHNKNMWRISLTNREKKKVEGYLLIQHP